MTNFGKYDSELDIMDLRFVEWTLVAAVFLFTRLVKDVTSVAVDVELGTKEAIEGEDVTFTCDLRDTEVDYIWFKNPNYFLTMGNSLIPSLNSNIANRIGVSCSENVEACDLLIFTLKSSDAGEYTCGYQDGDTRVLASRGYLNVLVPPADTSPQCILYNRFNTPISSDMVQVGDRVGLSCITTGGNPRPSVYVARNGFQMSTEYMGSITELYTLSQEDEGSTFTCVMTHPALSQPRTCTLLTLRRRNIPTVRAPTTINVPSSQKMTSQMTSSQYLSTTKGQDITVPSSGLTSMDMSTITIIIVVIVIVIVIVITTVVFGIWFIKRRRSDKDEIKIYPPRASQDPTMNLVAPHAVVSTDYDFVNNRDSNANMQESTINSNHISRDETVNTSNQDDAFPVYAKPEKPGKCTILDNKTSSTRPGEYENMPPVSNGSTTQARQGEDGIMYAELELSVDANTNSTIISGDADDVTVYADIKKT